MADSNNTPPNQNTLVLNCPTISIPKDFELSKQGYLLFDIPTSAGENINVQAFGSHCLCCKGTFAAFAALGLLRSEWLPGIPGNNKISQRVVFDNDGAHLIYGNLRGSKVPPLHITIQRVSGRLYSVNIPTTDQQKAFLGPLLETAYAKVLEERLDTPEIRTPSKLQDESIFPAVAATYHIRTTDHVKRALFFIYQLLIGEAYEDGRPNEPACYPKEVQDAVLSQIGEMQYTIFESRPIRRKEWVTEEAARLNPTLQKMLKQLAK